MIFLLRFKRYFICPSSNLIVNDNLCGIIKCKDHKGRCMYLNFSSTGYQEGGSVTIFDGYFNYSEKKGDYLHGIQVNINDNHLRFAGRYSYGKLHGYCVNSCDSNYVSTDIYHYIGATYNRGIANKIELIKMQNKRMIYKNIITIKVDGLFRNIDEFNKLEENFKSDSLYKYSNANGRDYSVYTIYKKPNIVVTYDIYFDSSIDIQYDIDDYRFIIYIDGQKQPYNLNILKNYNFQSDIINEMYHVAEFDWSSDMTCKIYINRHSKCYMTFRYDKCLKQWIKHNTIKKFDEIQQKLILY